MVAFSSTCSWLDDFAEVIRENENDRGANHLYSVAALTDSSGAVVERYRYDSYGNRTVLAADGVTTRTASLYGNQVGFTGRYLDKETGLWYFRARYYSGGLGRFVGRDQYRFAATYDSLIVINYTPTPVDCYVNGQNQYAGYFATNDVDPSGYCTCDTTTPLGLWRPPKNPTVRDGVAGTTTSITDKSDCSYETIVGLAWDIPPFVCATVWCGSCRVQVDYVAKNKVQPTPAGGWEVVPYWQATKSTEVAPCR